MVEGSYIDKITGHYKFCLDLLCGCYPTTLTVHTSLTCHKRHKMQYVCKKKKLLGFNDDRKNIETDTNNPAHLVLAKTKKNTFMCEKGKTV